MVGRVKRLPLLALAVCVGLVACQKAQPESLAQRVLFTANGSYDASADERPRLGQGMRRVHWASKPPLAAAQVTVDFESDQRPQAWIMTLTAPRVTASELLGQGAAAVGTPDGTGYVVRSGALRDVLALPGAGQLRLISRGYATHHLPELLSAFAP